MPLRNNLVIQCFRIHEMKQDIYRYPWTRLLDKSLEWGPKCRFIWRVEQFIIYEDTVATCSASRAGLLSRAKPIQVRLSGDST